MGFLVAGLVAGVLFTPARRYIKSPWLWAGIALSLLIFLPNFLWMAQHDFISFQKLSAMHARDVGNGYYKWFLLDQLYSAANPSSIYLWVFGLYFFWRTSSDPNYRPLVWMYAIPLVGFLVTQGRGYYLAPAYPMLIAGGAYYVGEKVRNLTPTQRNERFSWLYYSLIIGGLCAASISMPVAPVNSFWWKLADNNHELYREEVGWPEMVKTVADIRDTIPLEERSHLGILAGNYGEAGAINIYGPAYNLPHAISGIDSYWLWGYGNPPPEIVIVLGLKSTDINTLFGSCSIAGTIVASYGIQNEETKYHPNILICRHLRQPWEQFWKYFQYFG
jgi:hypothetical protein